MTKPIDVEFHRRHVAILESGPVWGGGLSGYDFVAEADIVDRINHGELLSSGDADRISHEQFCLKQEE